MRDLVEVLWALMRVSFMQSVRRDWGPGRLVRIHKAAETRAEVTIQHHPSIRAAGVTALTSPLDFFSRNGGSLNRTLQRVVLPLYSIAMSISIAFNLSDGVVIAVDSATTMIDATGSISKVFMDADKLFQLGDLKVGIATYGVAALHGRTIGSFIREFALLEENADLDTRSIKEIVERLRVFFLGHYRSFLEKIHSQPFDEIPQEKKGALGLVVGGFSAGSFQSEVWEINVPFHATENSSRCVYAVGVYGLAWFASAIPINRYIKGIDPMLSVKLRSVFEGMLGRGLSTEELGTFSEAIGEFEYPIQTNGMPIQSGIACAKFLVDFVLGHYRFAETHPIVGGKATVGIVTYGQNAFQILE